MRPLTAPTEEGAHRRGWFARGLIRLPDRLIVVFLALVIAVAPTVSLKIFYPWLVVSVFVVALVLLWRLVPTLPGTSRSQLWASVAAVGFAAAWVACNIPLMSQLLWVTRDPGIYTVLGVYLSNHPNPNLDVSTATELAKGIPGLTANLGGFAASPDGTMNLQGGALVPALLAVGGWLIGIKGVLATNLVMAGGALVAVYGLARRVLGPWLALVPEVAIGLSVAFVYLARAPYTEIAMTAVCAAALTWLVCGLRERRMSLFVVAGLLAGTSGFARIDGALAVIGAGISLGLAALLVADRERARTVAFGTLWFAIAGGVMVAASALSLRADAPIYYTILKSQAHGLWAATGAALVVALLVVAIRLRVAKGLPDKAVKWLAWIGSIGVGVGFLVLLSRPLWYVAHNTKGANYIANIAALQAQDGLPIDGTRSYDEYSLIWFGWYFGWPTVALILIGLYVMVYIAIRRRSVPLFVILGATLAASALYLVQLQVTPDQPWAFRRVLPLITTGFLIAAVYPLWMLWKRGGWKRIVGGVLAAMVAFAPLITWNGLMLVPDEAHEYAATEQMCAALDPDKPVLLGTTGAPANIAIDIRTACDLQVVSGSDLTTAELQALRQRDPDIQVIVFAEGALPGATDLGAPEDGNLIVRWQTRLLHIPDRLIGATQQFWVGSIDPAGDFALGSGS